MTWGAAMGVGGAQAGSNMIAAGQTLGLQRQAQQWAKRMHATHYQRTVKDMRAAGLNPMLAMKMGAPVPSASSGTASGAGVGAAIAAGSQAATAERSARPMRKQVGQQTKNLAAQYRNIEKQGNLLDQQQITESLRGGVFAAQIPKETFSAMAQRQLGYMLEQQGHLAGFNAELARLGIPAAAADAALFEAFPWLRKTGSTLKELAPILGISEAMLRRLLRRSAGRGGPAGGADNLNRGLNEILGRTR